MSSSNLFWFFFKLKGIIALSVWDMQRGGRDLLPTPQAQGDQRPFSWQNQKLLPRQTAAPQTKSLISCGLGQNVHQHIFTKQNLFYLLSTFSLWHNETVGEDLTVMMTAYSSFSWQILN